MTVTLRKIGNSQGVIIPASILQEIGDSESFSLEFNTERGEIILKPERKRRMKKPAWSNWRAASKQIRQAGDDHARLPDVFVDEDLSEWQW